MDRLRHEPFFQATRTTMWNLLEGAMGNANKNWQRRTHCPNSLISQQQQESVALAVFVRVRLHCGRLT